MIGNDHSKEMYQIIKKIGQSLDIRVKEEHRWSSADICYAEGGRQMIDGLGPLGTKTKGSGEYILRHSILERSALLALWMSDIANNVKN